jgi:hypothetical protein
MSNKDEKRDQSNKTLNRMTEQVLNEAKIVARWAKKPFYIS